MNSVPQNTQPAGWIRVQGARENNLRDVNLKIPKHQLTVFTGVSGSGKSSLVFNTVAAESQRLINETYSAFVQGFMPSMARPDVEALGGLTAAVIVDQQPLSAHPRSTVGTVTDAGALLRILFSRLSEPHIGNQKAFAFNVATADASGTMVIGGKTVEKTASVVGGMCLNCEGFGFVTDIDPGKLLDSSLSLAQGAITVPGWKPDGWVVQSYIQSGFFDPNKTIGDYSPTERADLLERDPEKIKVKGVKTTYENLPARVRKTFLAKDKDSLQPHIRAFVERAATFASCPDCGGTRLNEVARSAKIAGVDIGQANTMQMSDLSDWVRSVRTPATATLVSNLCEALDAFTSIGLGYLSLDRATGTLSGGEAQRVRMVRHLSSALTDVTYVFDEPTVGLHPHDIQRMNELLLQLRSKGNTVLVVEHKPETIRIADHVVDMGPLAGNQGGEVVYQGTVEGLKTSGTLTGRHLDARVSLKPEVRRPGGAIKVRGADDHNLKNVDVDIPLGVLTVLTGVAGSGKSSLISGSVAQQAGVAWVDQSPIRGSRRSNPATYTGLLEPIRKTFAKVNGVRPNLFSPNSDGACPQCNGAGVIFTDLAILAGAAITCDECEGRRFRQSVLEYQVAGRSIGDMFEMPVAAAEEFFGQGGARTPAAQAILRRLVEVGLGYLPLGQPLTTLSGGERQRLKLANQMTEDSTVFVLDEPTSGMHLADVENLLALLDRLIDAGRSMIVIEHHMAVMAHADWIIDLGPGAGHDGGEVVFEGTPHDLVAKQGTLTGQQLAAYVVG